MSHVFFLLVLWNVTVEIHSLAVANLIQDLHLGTIAPATMILHVLLTLACAPFVQLSHSLIFISALIRAARYFVVIKKILFSLCLLKMNYRAYLRRPSPLCRAVPIAALSHAASLAQ
jgi:hypothetical protein